MAELRLNRAEPKFWHPAHPSCKYAFRRFKTLRRDEVGRFKLLRINYKFSFVGKMKQNVLW